MAIEVWGTFSVRDHLVSRAFVADVLLYDRLVIPTLPGSEAEADWPVEWDIHRQKSILADLGDLAIAIPWTKDRQSQWQRRFDDAQAEERRAARAETTEIIREDVAIARDPQYADLPFRITRNLLQDFANDASDDKLFKKLRVTRKQRPGSTLEAVSAYPSYEAFASDVSLVAGEETGETVNRLVPTRVFGWEFFIPDSVDFGVDEDRKLLAKAVDLATKPDFIESRAEFYKWWSDVSAGGISSEDAKADMKERIAEFGKMMKGQGWKTTARYAIKIADAFSGGLGLVSEVASAGAEAFLGSADVFADERLKRENAPPRLKVAAIFHDARNRFGWKTSKQPPP
jgi:hypothetical protein